MAAAPGIISPFMTCLGSKHLETLPPVTIPLTLFDVKDKQKQSVKKCVEVVPRPETGSASDPFTFYHN